MTGHPQVSDAHLQRAARRLIIEVPRMSTATLVRKASAHYNSRNPGKRPADPLAVAGDPTFFARLAVNYLRHACTDYDRNRDMLRQIGSRWAGDEVGRLIKARTLVAIAAAYPELAAEARRQARRADEDTPHRGRRTAPRTQAHRRWNQEKP